MKVFSLLAFLMLTGILTAGDVTVYFNKKHTVGGVDHFQREKFITIHSANYEGLKSGGAALMSYLINDLDVYYGRETGNFTSLSDSYPTSIVSACNSSRTSYARNSTAHSYEANQQLIVTGQYRVYDAFKTAGGHDAAEGGRLFGDYASIYLNEACGTGGTTGVPRPKWIEVLNEPLWDPIDQYVLWKTSDPLKPSVDKEKEILDNIFTFHREAAKEIHRQQPGTKVGGFAEAFPDPESRNWFNWETRWKRFIDIAGDEMDYYSFHLYDFNEPTVKFRKGGNLEAYMDLLSQYTYLTWGKEKPFLISEYGARTRNIEDQKSNPKRDWLCASSINSMMVQFMDRPDMIEKTIPFIMAVWSKDWNIFNPDKTAAEFTDYIKFYKLWRDVKGTRLMVNSSNLDMQVDAYTNGDKTYLILNNIKNEAVTVNLSAMGISNADITSSIKRHFYWDNAVMLDEISQAGAPSSVTVNGMATMIIEFTTAQAPNIEKTATETRNYADVYKQAIVAGSAITFNVNNVSLSSEGTATLRLGVGRNHGLSLQPIVKFNNTALTVPTDYRGDAQNNKGSFFGMLEMEVPYVLIKQNNTVTVEFADAGGFVTSVVLRAFNEEVGNTHSAVVNANALVSLKVYPNPAVDQLYVTIDSNTKVIYSIYDIQGRLLSASQLSSKSIDISNLDAGAYLLKLESDRRVQIERFVKMK